MSKVNSTGAPKPFIDLLCELAANASDKSTKAYRRAQRVIAASDEAKARAIIKELVDFSDHLIAAGKVRRRAPQCEQDYQRAVALLHPEAKDA